MVEVSAAHIELTGDAKQLDAALNTAQQELRKTGIVAEKTRSQLRGLGAGMTAASKQVSRAKNSYKGFSGGVRNASFQLADFAVMVDGGMGASRALATQLPQLLGGMGLLGAALGAVVAIGFPLGGVLADAAAGGADVAGAFGVLQPLLVSMASAFKVLGDVAVNSINFLINNLDQVIITAGVAAVAFGGPLVASFVAAKVATITLSGALAFLKKALIRTGIGALVVGVGYLIERFATLSERVGGISGAFSLLTDVVVEEMNRIRARVGEIFTTLKISLVEFERDAVKAFQDTVPDSVKLGAQIIIRTFNAIKEVGLEVFGAVWSAAMGEGFQLPDVGAAITRGFTGAIPDFLKSNGPDGESPAMQGYKKDIEELTETLRTLEGAAIAPRVALQRLRELLAESGTGDFDIRGIFGGGGDDGEELANQKDNNQKDKLKERVDALRNALIQENSTEHELLVQKLATRAKLLQEARDAEIIQEQEHKAILLELNESHANAMAAIKEKEVGMITRAQRGMFGELGNLFSMFAGKSKAAAIASIAINKALSIASIIQNTAAAQVRALAELGPILGPPAAAKIGAFGKIQAAIVAASGFAQAGAAMSGGGGGTLSTMAGGGGEAPAPVSRNVAISVTGGDMFSRDQVVGLINQINEAVEDGAVVRLA